MRFEILTLFPLFFSSPLKQSIIGRAIERGQIDVRIHDIRDYATGRHRTADDAPYGGGSGMVLKVEPVVRAIEAVAAGVAGKRGPQTAVLLTTPAGESLCDKMARRLATLENLVIVCGRYEGVDERIRAFVDMEVSLGDYILTGGEIAALAIVDSAARFIPGVLGDAGSIKTESFSEGLLEYPQYTRPEEFRGMRVPEVLLSGNHRGIEMWRRKESLKRTFERRPELIKLIRGAGLTEEDREFIKELQGGGG